MSITLTFLSSCSVFGNICTVAGAGAGAGVDTMLLTSFAGADCIKGITICKEQHKNGNSGFKISVSCLLIIQ